MDKEEPIGEPHKTDDDSAGNERVSEEPSRYLPSEMSLAEFEDAVGQSTTVLEIQQRTRLPRWKVKRLLHHADLGERVESTAAKLSDLRDGDDESESTAEGR
jgi:hypothetical protein